MSDIEVLPPTLPQFQPGPVMTAAEAIVHALCGAQYGDLEFDVGKSIRWTQWFTDDVFITDVNLGSPRYWIVNWAITYPQAWHAVTGVNYFYSTVAFRKEQWRQAKLEQHIQYDQEDWVLFVDASEGLAIDTRDPQPINADVEPFKSYLYREVQRAETAGKDRVVLPFYAFQRHDNIVTAYYESPAFADGSLGYTRATATMGTPYYVPYQGLTRLIKVKVLDDPAFNWATIDTPSTAATGLNIAIVSYGYAHWNLQDIVPPATTVEPLAEANDDGYRMRNLLSLVRPVTGLPYGTPYHPLAQDTGAIPGPWAATDQFTPDPVVDSGPYLDTSLGTISTPDTIDMGLDGKFRITVRVWVRARPSTGFPTLVNKTGAGFANREYMIYVANTSGATAYSTTNPAFTANVDGGIIGAVPTDKDHILGFEATPGVLVYTQIVDAARVLNGVGVAPVFPDTATALKVGDTGMSARLYWAQMDAISRARLVFDAANSYATVPDAVPLNINGDFEIIARYTQPDWETLNIVSPNVSVLCGAFGNFQLTVRVYYGVRTMMLQWTGLGIGTAAQNGDLQWNYPTGWPAGQPVWVRFRFDADNGAGGHSMSFDYSTAQTATEPTTWTTGPVTTKVGTVSIAPRTGAVKNMSSGANQFLNGRLARFIVRNGIPPAGALNPAATRFNFPGAIGNYLRPSNDNVINSLPGDVEVVARIQFDSTMPGQGMIVGCDGSPRGWAFEFVGSGTGKLRLLYPLPGTIIETANMTGITNGSIIWVRMRRTASTGATAFWWAADALTEPSSWTALTNGATTLTPGAFPVMTGAQSLIGARSTSGINDLFKGRFSRVIVRNGFAGTTVLDVDQANVQPGQASFTATVGGTITVNQRQQPIFVFPGTAGNYLSVPDAAAFDITSDFTIMALGTFTAPVSGGTVLGKRESATTNSYRFDILSSGLPRLMVSPNGTDASQVILQGATPIPFSTRQWIAATFDADNGASASSARFFTSTDGTTWVPLGAAVTGVVVASVFNSTSKIEIGTTTNGTQNFLVGALERVILNTGIGAAGVPGGTTVLDIDRTQFPVTVGATSFAATVGGTVTVNQSGATICQPDPSYQFPIVQGTVLDVSENNAGTMTDPTHFVATSGQAVALTQAAIVQPQADSVLWRFDAKDYPGTGTVFTDPRGRTWTLTAAGALVANAVDNMPQPVTPDPSLAGLLVPLYDNVLRINMRDGVWYEGGELGNIPLAWDDATQTWYPSNMSPQEWHDSQSWVAPVG